MDDCSQRSELVQGIYNREAGEGYFKKSKNAVPRAQKNKCKPGIIE